MAPVVRWQFLLGTFLSQPVASVHFERETICTGGVTLTFPEFVAKYGRLYKEGTPEYEQRAANFAKHTASISKHNCAPAGASDAAWTAGINEFIDWSDAELRALHGFKRSSSARNITSKAFARQTGQAHWRDNVPDSLSWSHLTAISTPRDQGSCGSCWAFAAETSMRARAEISGRSSRFSVSQIVSCTPNPHSCGGKGGCDGATPELAFEYALQAGAVSEDDFSYPVGGGARECPVTMAADANRRSPPTPTSDGGEAHWLGESAPGMRGRSIGMIGWTKLPENREEPLVRALTSGGPMAVAVAASGAWSFYSAGVLSKRGCDQGNVISHAVVLFGFGFSENPITGEAMKYWHLKNSWGSGWGERGNMRLARADDEEQVCGWDEHPEKGSGCEGGPSRVYVCGTCGILFDTAVPHFSRPAPAPSKAGVPTALPVASTPQTVWKQGRAPPSAPAPQTSSDAVDDAPWQSKKQRLKRNAVNAPGAGGAARTTAVSQTMRASRSKKQAN